MADIKISDLTDSGALTGSELIPVVQSGTTLKCTTQDIADLTALPYKYWAGYISQSGSSAPSVVNVQNSFPAPIVWSRVSAGQYLGTLSGAFPNSKLFMPVVSSFQPSPTPGYLVRVAMGGWSVNEVFLFTGNIEIATGTETYQDSLINDWAIEIRVYN